MESQDRDDRRASILVRRSPHCVDVHRDVHKDMRKRYSIADARTNLPSIVDEAEAGHEIELTRRGKPVAVVLSLREVERLRGRERSAFGDAYRRFLKTHPLDEVGLERDELASLRDRSVGRKVKL